VLKFQVDRDYFQGEVSANFGEKVEKKKERKKKERKRKNRKDRIERNSGVFASSMQSHTQ